MALMGAKLIAVEPGYCAIALVPRPEVSQQHGYVHAGVGQRDRRHARAGMPALRCSRRQLGADRRIQAQPAGARGRRAAGRRRPRDQARAHARDHARRSARGARRQAYAGRDDAANVDGDARQARRVAALGREDRHAELSRTRLRSSARRRHAARDRAAVRRRRDRAARRRRSTATTSFRRPVAQDGRPRPARHHRRGGYGGARDGLPRARRRDGGDLARLGVGRAVVRRALESVRQPDPPQRQRGAEAQATCRS